MDPGRLIQRIVAPLALSGRAAAVAREADRLARQLGAELILLHVGPQTAAKQAAFAAHLASAGLADRQVVFRPGAPARVIRRAARDLSADLIVAGALEREGPLSYYVGSVARRVARGAHCSVLLLTEPRTDPQPFQRWVVGVDYDAPGLATLRFAMDLARVERPQYVEAAYEYDLPAFGMAVERGLDVRGADAARQRIHRDEQAGLAEFLTGVDTSGVNLRPICLRGREGWEVAEHARRNSADLLIVPAPPRLTFWDKFFQHGVEFMLESLPCALWLHRPTSV